METGFERVLYVCVCSKDNNCTFGSFISIMCAYYITNN